MGDKRKSTTIAVLLVVVFGSWGLFYSTVKGAIIMLLVSLITILFYMWSLTGGLLVMNPSQFLTAIVGSISMFVIIRIVGIIWAYQAVNDNKYFGIGVGGVLIHILAFIMAACAVYAIYDLLII